MDDLTEPDGDMDEAEFHRVLPELLAAFRDQIPQEYHVAFDNLLGSGEYRKAFEHLLTVLRVYGLHVDPPQWLRIYGIAGYLDIDVATQLGVIPDRESAQQQLSALGAKAGFLAAATVKALAKLHEEPTGTPIDVADLYDDIQHLEQQVLRAQYHLCVLRSWIDPHLRIDDADWFVMVPALVAGFLDRVPAKYRDGFDDELLGGEYDMAVESLIAIIEECDIEIGHGEHQLLKRLLASARPTPGTFRALYDRCGCTPVTT